MERDGPAAVQNEDGRMDMMAPISMDDQPKSLETY